MSARVEADGITLARLENAGSVTQEQFSTNQTTQRTPRLYSQFADPQHENAVYVRQGFSWTGLLFGGAWLIFHGMRGWIAGFIMLMTVGLATMVAVSLAITEGQLSAPGIVFPLLALVVAHIIIGLQGSQWRCLELKNRGWRDIQVIAAPNLKEANQFGEAALIRLGGRSDLDEDDFDNLIIGDTFASTEAKPLDDVEAVFHQPIDHAAIKRKPIDPEKVRDKFVVRKSDDLKPHDAEPDRVKSNRVNKSAKKPFSPTELPHDVMDSIGSSADPLHREVDDSMVGEEYREFVRIAQRELDQGRVHKGSWARAFATYADDEASVRKRYICLRAQSLAEKRITHSEQEIPGAATVARVRANSKSLSPREFADAKSEIQSFARELIQTQSFDKYAIDLLRQVLEQFDSGNQVVEERKIVGSLANIGLRLYILPGPGKRKEPTFVEYRIASEIGDVLHLPDRDWLKVCLNVIHGLALIENGQRFLGQTVGSKSGRQIASVEELDALESAAEKIKKKELAAARSDQFLRFMSNESERQYSVYQRSIDGPDVDIEQLWSDALSSVTEEEEWDAPAASDARDRYSRDWVDDANIPDGTEIQSRESRATAFQDRKRLSAKEEKKQTELKPPPKTKSQENREFLMSVVDETNEKRIGIFVEPSDKI